MNEKGNKEVDVNRCKDKELDIEMKLKCGMQEKKIKKDAHKSKMRSN
jgi:hypothetical protein